MFDTIAGAGLGLRSPHYSHILDTLPAVPWFEILIDNFLQDATLPHRTLERIRSHYPVVFHGVGMNLGSADPLHEGYFARLKELKDRYQPSWISDHLCWTGVSGTYANDLLPLPFNEATINFLVSKIVEAQERLGTYILIENLSSYVLLPGAECSEWEFLVEVAKRSGCYLLLDVNNVYVNSVNFEFDPKNYLEAIPRELVKQFHLAGHLRTDTLIIDSHGDKVCGAVWELYQLALQRFGKVPTLLEWDTNIPEFNLVWEEAKKAQKLMDLA